MIILKNLKWSNWFSYGENNYIDFENSILTQILGVNGVGKSSIILIVEEVLYNKNSKGIKKADIMNRNAKSLYAELKFSIDIDNYIIKLNRKSSAKITLIKNDIDISSHTATNTFKEIQRIIGIDFSTFTQLVYQNSKNGLEFLTSADSARKKFLISLFNLDNYTEYYETFKRAYNETNLINSELEGKKSVITSWIEQQRDTDFSIKQIKKELDDSKLHIILSDIKDLKDKIFNIDRENDKINRNNKAIIIFDKFIKPEKLGDKPIKNEDLVIERGILNKDILNYNKIIRDLNSLSDSICSTCLQPIDTNIKEDMLFDVTANLKSKKERLVKCNDLIDTEDILLKNFKELKAEHDRYNDSKSKILHNIPTIPYIKDDLEKTIIQIKSEYDTLKHDINIIIKHNKEVSDHNTKIETILVELEKNKHQLDDINEKLTISSKVKSKLNVLKSVFSTKGLVSYKIDFLVKDLQDKINEYLINLSSGRFQINFILKSDSINIGIIDNGIDINISALSTGELSRVNVATLLAIRSLMSSLSNTKINLLFLDEILGVLDDIGKESLIDILLNEKDLNTLIVSHTYTHPLLDKLYIKKNRGGSIIE